MRKAGQIHRDGYTKRLALTLSWAMYNVEAKALENSFETVLLVDTGLCPECMSASYLVRIGACGIKCLKCQGVWLILEAKLDSTVALPIDNSEFWTDEHIDQLDQILEAKGCLEP